MHFQLEQRFSAPLAAVEAAFVDPTLLHELGQMGTLGRPELLEHVEEGHVVRQRVRHTFTGQLSAAVRAVVDPARLTWVDESVLDRRTHTSEFEIVPDHYPDRLQCTGTVTLEERDGETRRLTAAELRVNFPLLAPRVEEAIVAGLRDHAAAEEEVVRRWLEDQARGRATDER